MRDNYDKYVLSREEIIKYYLVAALIGVIISILMYDNVIFSAIVFVPLIYCKKYYEGELCRKRKKQLLDEFKDTLYLISTSFSLGRNMLQALEEAAGNLSIIYGNKSLMVMEIETIIYGARESNEREDSLLKDFANRTGLEDIKDFYQVYESCRESGGNIVEGVNSAASVIGEKISIEREIKAAMAQRRYEGRIICLMPFVIIAFLKFSSADYIQVMYDTLAGRIIMTIALGIIGASVILIERISKINV